MNRRQFLASAAQTGVSIVAGGAMPVVPGRAGAMKSDKDLVSTDVISLDGEWLLATDPKNAGRDQGWQNGPVPSAKETQVPYIIQDAFPGYHGVAWYWREFTPPVNPHPQGRHLLRFWAVDYKADVWLNGVPVGGHEGGETPFTLDVTDAARPEEANLLAVRVLNSTHEPIDGIVLNETPHRNKALPYSAGNDWDHGGIMDSVEWMAAPVVRIEDLFARPDPKTGVLRIQANLRNAGRKIRTRLEFTVAPAASGETLDAVSIERDLPAGDTLIEDALKVVNPRLWNLNDPFLYRVTARAQAKGSHSFEEHSARCGFRDFRFENGCFRLNGRRLFLRCSHTGNCTPVGLQIAHDPDLLRRDLLNVKVMGFNAIRFIAGIAARCQLDLCDEIGLMVYQEHYGSWVLGDSPKMKERYDRSTAEMIKRDRNHPSVVMWGMLNETSDGPVFRHAVASLPLVRSLDDTRMVMLNSGRFDGQTGSPTAGLEVWRTPDGPDPNVTHNPTGTALSGLGITWQPGQMALHPGPKGEYSAIRWIAPENGDYTITATFTGIAQHATTDTHVLHNGKQLYARFINDNDQGNESSFSQTLALVKGGTLDFVIGFGNGDYGGDTTAISIRIQSKDGKVYDPADAFSVKANPNGPWSYGFYTPGAVPDAETFKLYPIGETISDKGGIGSLSNPGSNVWEDVLSDQHPYQRVPHTAGIIRFLRTVNGGKNPVFISEYGIGSAVDLWRATRHYERLGKTEAEDARFYRDKLDRFLADWERWKMAECFTGPEEFFAASNRRMAGQRLLGLNAIRANPNVVGHSLTGTVDQGMTGEGLFTTFRELKPGTTDAVFEGLAPLRLCLFAEPVNVLPGRQIRLDAVLANEDALPPGEYPVRLQVVGPDMKRLLQRTVTVKVPTGKGKKEPPFAIPFFSEEVRVEGHEGKYRFLAAMERGGAPTGGETEFYVTDPARMPPIKAVVTLWGDDPELAKWLAESGIRKRPFHPAAPAARELLLASRKPSAPGNAEAWRDLARRVVCGATAVFVAPEVFRRGDHPTGWLPLKNKGTVTALPNWLYHKDEWAKTHPIFDGLPCGGLMDYSFYRDVIPDIVYAGQDAPLEAVAGAVNAAIDYSSGLLVAVYQLGAGRIILNTLSLLDSWATSPVATILLGNMLRYAARDMDKPVVKPPSDLDGLFKQIGYL
jgi:hypothetical protein